MWVWKVENLIRLPRGVCVTWHEASPHRHTHYHQQPLHPRLPSAHIVCSSLCLFTRSPAGPDPLVHRSRQRSTVYSCTEVVRRVRPGCGGAASCRLHWSSVAAAWREGQTHTHWHFPLLLHSTLKHEAHLYQTGYANTNTRRPTCGFVSAVPVLISSTFAYRLESQSWNIWPYYFAFLCLIYRLSADTEYQN